MRYPEEVKDSDTCLKSGDVARGSCRKSARRAVMHSAPVAAAFALSRCNRLVSLSKAKIRPLPCINAAAHSAHFKTPQQNSTGLLVRLFCTAFVGMSVSHYG